MSSVKVDLQSNLCNITPSRSAELALAEVPKAVKRAGFAPAEMTIRARGTYEGQGFRIAGWKHVLSVKASGTPPAGEVSIRARVDYGGEAPVLEPLP